MYNAIILLSDMESILTDFDFKALFFSLLVVFIVYVISLIKKNNKMKRELNALHEWRIASNSLNLFIKENKNFKGKKIKKRLKKLIRLEEYFYQEWRKMCWTGLDND